HVLDGRLAHLLELLRDYQGPAAVSGERLVEQGTVNGIADQMAAPHSTTAGLRCSIQQLGLVIAAKARHMRRNLRWPQFTHQIAVLVEQAALGTIKHQFVGLQIDRRAGGDVFTGQIEAFPGGRVAQWGQQHDGRSEEHTSELQSRENLVCRLLLEKKKNNYK